ncbi:hypothetical protein N3K66_007967 [Trichothecium roseum]|uniref:Uncharacterized protein n=1 Tax=Trichothecium roseum TaxID=47278 RepID=A0ACC0US39_9HYPO|nr:hypothetical protein N3K66_007967 [Trichothecium roseum]
MSGPERPATSPTATAANGNGNGKHHGGTGADNGADNGSDKNSSSNGVGAGLDDIRATVGDRALHAYGCAQRSMDRVVSRPRRERAYRDAQGYAATRPVMTAFVLSQLVFCFLPILIFAIFSLSTVAFALVCALLFSLFWSGLAFMALVPTLLACFFVALIVWAWAVGGFLVARAAWKRIPGSVRSDVVAIEGGGESGESDDSSGGGSAVPEDGEVGSVKDEKAEKVAGDIEPKTY